MYMDYKSIRVREDVYKKLAEMGTVSLSFSDVIEQLIGKRK